MYMVDCQWRALHQDGYKYLVSKKRERNKEKNWVGTCLYGLGYPRQPFPRVTLGEVIF